MIDCVGMEASAAHGQGGVLAAVKEKMLPSERMFVLDQAILAVRPGGVSPCPASMAGRTVNMGAIVQKSLKLVSGQTSVKRYLEPPHEADPGKEGRYDLDHLTSQHQARRRTGPLPDLQRQERRLHEGRLSSRRLMDPGSGRDL